MTDICSQPANCKTPYGTYTPVKGKYYLLLMSFTVTIPFAYIEHSLSLTCQLGSEL